MASTCPPSVVDLAAGRPVSDSDREHIEHCPICRHRVRELSAILSARRRLEDGEPPAELSENVLRRLAPVITDVAQRPRGRGLWRPLLWAAAATCMVLVGVGAWSMLSSSEESSFSAMVVATVGDVEVSAGGTTTQALPQQTVAVGGAILTPTDGVAWLNVGQARIALQGSARLLLQAGSEDRARLWLGRGELVSSFDRNGSHLEIAFPHGELSVVGTLFRVRATPQQSELAVAEGRVHVLLHSGRELDVSEGQRLVVGDTGVRIEAVARDARVRFAAALEGRLALRRSPRVEEPPVDEPPNQVVEEPVSPPARVSKSKAPTAERVRDLSRRGRCRQAENTANQLPVDLPDADRARALVSAADCYLAKREWNSVLRVYRRTAKRLPETAAGENAAYEVGRILRRMDKNDEADAAFAEYMKHYPKGSLASEALYARCTLAMSAADVQRALGCLRRFRRDFPRSRRLAETHLLEATLLRIHKKDCQGAIAAYDRYLAAPGELKQQAESWRDWCRQQIK